MHTYDARDWEVNALLERRKTQIRVPMIPQPVLRGNHWQWDHRGTGLGVLFYEPPGACLLAYSPFGEPRDTLLVCVDKRLEVLRTWAEMLHSLTEGDAQREGHERPILAPGPTYELGGMKLEGHPFTGYYLDAMKKYWDERYPDYLWIANPWVWACEIAV